MLSITLRYAITSHIKWIVNPQETNLYGRGNILLRKCHFCSDKAMNANCSLPTVDMCTYVYCGCIVEKIHYAA